MPGGDAKGDQRAALEQLVAAEGLEVAHSPEAEAEVAAWLRAPGIDDASLDDRTDLPMVTIDGPGTRDLDQALAIEPTKSGWIAHYAIADAAWFVRPGSHLWSEALRRGASFYLPGLSVPMLPRALSEGLVSLGPRVDRRAMLFSMHVEKDGTCRSTSIARARIRSRAQLDFAAAARAIAGTPLPGVDDAAVYRSLAALRAFGEARLRAAAERDVVRGRIEEVRVRVDEGPGLGFVVLAELRNDVELWNEQLSLMCNVEGARVLQAGARDRDLVQPIYRVHPAPDPERLAALALAVAATVERHGLPAAWRWNADTEPLSAYLARIPEGGRHERVARAIARQAILVNERSSFSPAAAPHFGIGAEVYARFSAPMREIVGVFVHKEAWETLEGQAQAPGDDELRAAVIAQANAARERQRRLTHAANLLVIDALLSRDAALPVVQRPVRTGTVMGALDDKVYVRLDDPPIDVKIYRDGLGGGTRATDGGAILRRGDDVVCALGDAVGVKLVAHDPRRKRWTLRLVDVRSPG
jgi:ribonuclease R